jgi:1-acyl-sn-glycerol-3-phosphate acyltransferase
MSAPLSHLVFKLTGWKSIGKAPDLKKYIVTAAPHTSNWDFVFGLAAWNIYGMKPKYLIKKEFFYFPLNILFWLTGGVAVDRSKNNSLTDAIVDMFNAREEFIVIFPPEGTRKKVERWKTGFYYVALKANLPIVLGALDFKTKSSYLSEPFYPTGDIEKDFIVIREFYKNTQGRNPEWFNVDGIRPA